MAGVRREKTARVSVSRYPSGQRLFTGQNEAYIMNRKKKEKRVLREERNVSVLSLYVKVPAGATAPVDDEAWKLT